MRLSNFFPKHIWPVLLLLTIAIFAYREFVFLGKIPLPGDALVGAYYPWLNSKWGYPVGVPIKNPSISDTFSLFYPWKQLETNLFKKFTIPFWNKYAFSGTPLLADYHSAVFFPPNIVFLISSKYGWALYIFLSTLSCLISMSLFLSNHIKGILARSAGAIVFAFSGLMTTWAEFGTAVWGISFLPLALYFLDKHSLTNKNKYLSIFSLVICLMVLSGNVQVDIFALTLIATYIFFVIKKKRLRSFIFILFGLLLASPQLLPTVEFYSHSIRAGEKFSSLFNFGLIPFLEVFRLWVPDFFGNPTRGNYFGKLDYHEISPFLGTLTLPLLIPLFVNFTKLPRIIKFFGVVFILSLFLTFSSPVTRLIYSLPLPLLTYSYASRILFLTSTSIGILVAYILDHLLGEKKYTKIIALSSLLLAVISWLGLATIIPLEVRSITFRNLILPTVLLLSLFFLSLTKINKKIMILIIFLLISFDLTRYFNKQTPFIPSKLIFPTTPVIKFLQNQQFKPFRIAKDGGPIMPPNTWVYYGLESIEGYDPLRSEDYNRFFNIVANGKYTDTLGRFSELTDVDPKYLDLLNVKYFLTLKESEDRKISKVASKLINYGYQPIYEEGEVIILQNPRASDRAFFVSNVISVDNIQDLQKNLENHEFNPISTAIIEEQIGSKDNFSIGEVTYIKHEDNIVEIHTKNQTASFLVLSDSYDPNWTATVNNQPTHIYKVDGALRGVILPSGDNTILFKYQSKSFMIGIYLSILSGCLMTLLYIIGNKRHD